MINIPQSFNIRVYGLLLNQQGEIMLCDEVYQNIAMTKFPGGGLEFGEGIADALKREFLEELNLEIDIIQHLYTTDFYQVSAFNPQSQLVSVYYLVKPSNENQLPSAHQTAQANNIQCRWVASNELNADLLTWPIDKLVVEMILKKEVIW